MQYHKAPDNKVHAANMGPNWALSARDGPYVGPMNLAIGDRSLYKMTSVVLRTSHTAACHGKCQPGLGDRIYAGRGFDISSICTMGLTLVLFNVSQ